MVQNTIEALEKRVSEFYKKIYNNEELWDIINSEKESEIIIELGKQLESDKKKLNVIIEKINKLKEINKLEKQLESDKEKLNVIIEKINELKKSVDKNCLKELYENFIDSRFGTRFSLNIFKLMVKLGKISGVSNNIELRAKEIVMTIIEETNNEQNRQ